MFRRTAAAAAGTLLLLAAASWLPPHGSAAQPATRPLGDLARPALPVPDVLPAAAPGPLPAVSGFFWALSAAVTGQGVAGAAAPAPRSEAAGRPASEQGGPQPAAPGTEAFARAYSYLAQSWQNTLPFSAFVQGWAQTRALDLLAAIPAGPPAGDPSAERVFVEVRTLAEIGGETPHAVLGYAAGFYTAEPGPRGWHLRGGGLTPETFPLHRAGRSAGPDPVAAAAAGNLARQAGRPGAGSVPSVRVTAGPDHRASAAVRLGNETYTVLLYELVDGQWVALRVSR